MANELSGLGMGLDVGGQPREDVNKITEEAVQRADEQARQAKQTQQQIKRDKTINNRLADFLAHLMRTLTDEKLIKLMYDTFFKLKDPKTGVTYLKKKINTVVVVGFFFPFYPEESARFGITPFYQELLPEHTHLTAYKYLAYIKTLSGRYHDNIPIEQEHLLSLLMEILVHYKVLGNAPLSHEEYQTKKQAIQEQLYN